MFGKAEEIRRLCKVVDQSEIGLLARDEVNQCGLVTIESHWKAGGVNRDVRFLTHPSHLVEALCGKDLFAEGLKNGIVGKLWCLEKELILHEDTICR